MSRYFFHVRDGELLIPDPEGQELPTTEALSREASEAARELALQLVEAGVLLDEAVRLEVRDDAEQLVLTVPLVEVLQRRRDD